MTTGPSPTPGESPEPTREGGFALFVVVLLLFAVGASAAATYQIALLEHQLSGFSSDSERARSIAEAGLNRFLGEAVRGPPADADYFLDEGQALVSARRLMYWGPWEEIYRIRSEGRFLDPRHFDAPAVWEVTRYATLRAPPMNVLATIAATGTVVALPGTTVSGTDQAPGGLCRVAGTNVPASAENQSLADLALPPWSRLTDPSYPVDVEWTGGGWSLPAGYPVVRVADDPFTAGNNRSGRGVLIVPGSMIMAQNFNWEGIVLVGGALTTSTSPGHMPQVRGMIVAGAGGALSDVLISRGDYRFHSCHVLEAGLSMGVLNPEPQGWWSAY